MDMLCSGLQVNQVMDAMPKGYLKPDAEDEALDPSKIYRITYMFSATMPPSVERIAKKYMRGPVVVTIGDAGQAGSNVLQRIIMCKSQSDRDAHFFRVLDNFHRGQAYAGATNGQKGEDDAGAADEDEGYEDARTADEQEKKLIIFCNTRASCDKVERELDKHGYPCVVLHSRKTQEAREHAIRSLKDGSCPILLATDVAGRGIDVPNVALVINYDMPAKIEPYTHRIGRTGRAGKKGTAVSLVLPSDTAVFYDLKKFLEKAKQNIPAELARHEAANKPGGGGGPGGGR